MKFTKYEPGQNPNPGPTVMIVCDAASHEGREATLAFFTNGGRGWKLMPARSVKGEFFNVAMQPLYDETPLTAEEYQAIRMGDRLPRQRYELRCGLCGDSLVARSENLHPILDTLAGHADAWVLGLTDLRARLVK